MELFNLTSHNCATCEIFDICSTKDVIDIFRNKPDQLKEVISDLIPKLRQCMSVNVDRSTDDAEVILMSLMLIGYAYAKKEESLKKIEKIGGIKG